MSPTYIRRNAPMVYFRFRVARRCPRISLISAIFDVFSFDSIFLNMVLIIFCFTLHPFFEGSIRLNGREFDDTRSFTFVSFLDFGFHEFPVLYPCLVDGNDLFAFCEESFPPIHTLYRMIVRTCDES